MPLARRIASRILRIAVILMIVLLAPAIVIASWCFWLVVYAFCAISVVVSGRRTLFQYRDDCRDHP